MKLSVLLMLALPALSSATLETGNNAEQINDSDLNCRADLTANRWMTTAKPHLSVFTLRRKMHVEGQPSSFMSYDGSNLEWVTWNNNLPNDAIAIVNSYADNRIDYVCKRWCNAGYYTPSRGPYCYYRGTKTTDFEILVNKDSFEILKWIDDSYGHVPPNSVRTCAGEEIYVGKNKYGLGKIVTKDEAFFLPWDGGDYWYKYYQALTTTDDIVSQQIYDVIYNIDDSKIITNPPNLIHTSRVSNNECHTVTKTDTISKTNTVTYSWESTFAIKLGVKMSITAGLPCLVSGNTEISVETTYQISSGTTVTEEITDTTTVNAEIPPNHSCVVKMMRSDYKLKVPFTARLAHTYSNGEKRTTSITGTYDGVQIGEIRADVDRCERLKDATPCP